LLWGAGVAVIVVLGALALLSQFGESEKPLPAADVDTTSVAYDARVVDGIPRDAVSSLNALLKLKYDRVEEQRRKAEEWAGKYRELKKRLTDAPAGDKRIKQALAFLQQGKLDETRNLIGQLIGKEVNRVDILADDYYNLALSSELTFDEANAFKSYATAHRYKPDNIAFALSYAAALCKNNRFADAEAPFKRVLAAYRELAVTNPRSLTLPRL